MEKKTKLGQGLLKGLNEAVEAEKIVLSNGDFDRFVERLNNLTPPTPTLIRARQRYLDLQKSNIRDEMDEHMVKTSSAKRL